MRRVTRVAGIPLGVEKQEKLAATLTEMGHPISADTVRKELVNKEKKPPFSPPTVDWAAWACNQSF